MRLHLYEFNNNLPYATIQSFSVLGENSNDASDQASEEFNGMDLDNFSISLKVFDFGNDGEEKTDDWDFNPTTEKGIPYIGSDEYIPGPPEEFEESEE